ncbi:cell wall-binding repeat-containing protein [Clostridium sulfidigenes]|uniref:cell wall-binding repeat-containing protein n=1 Tax=Clostridium sulfidigenes TaxID=318464 RepID=UPI003F8AC2E2
MNKKKVSACILSGILTITMLGNITVYAAEEYTNEKNIEIVDSNNSIRAIDKNESVKENNNYSTIEEYTIKSNRAIDNYLTEVKAVEKPFANNISISSISAGDDYKANITISGQARTGNTVHAVIPGGTAEQLIGSNQSFAFNITTQSTDITVQLYAVDPKGNKSESVSVRLTKDGYDISNNGTTPSTNTLPVITAENVKLRVGDSFNALDNVTANDKEDGNLTSKIIVSGTVDTKKVGNYKVIYKVTDSDENTVTKERIVTVVEKTNEKPVLSGASDINIKVGDSLDAKAGVTATDLEDGNITSKIIVSGTVDTKKVGKYTLSYTVTDTDGNKVSINRIINVIARNVQVNELIGTDRYDTAVRLSKGQFTTANTVMIANGGALADGLAATPLATFKKAPLLLTGASSLPEGTKGEIKRLGAKNAIIVGGATVVNDNVIKELKALGVTNVERIGGTDRYDTSLEIAKYIDKNCYDVSKVVISNGLGQADALSIASVAGRDKMAIVLVEKDKVPTKVYSWLKGETLENAYIIGGTTVVADSVLNKVNGITLANISKNRLGGKDRYATNAMVIDKFYGSVVNKTYIAKGLQLIDALAAGPVAALNGSPVVLSGVDLTTEQKTVLDKRFGNIIIRTGGGIADKAVNSLKSCIEQ